MSEMLKNNGTEPAKTEEQKKQPAPAKPLEMRKKGTLQLLKPIRANDKEHTELAFDFGALSGWDFINAMDSDLTGMSNAFRMTDRQALALFSAAVVKCTADIDAEDIKQRIGVEDCIKATQLAALFFTTSSQAGNLRILN